MAEEKKYVTESEIPIKLYYTPNDLEGWDYEKELGYPGNYPYIRGVYETMYRGKMWTMRLYSGLATAEESNKRYKYLLSQGQTGLSVALDLPTQLGYDSDYPLVEDEVGRIGVAIDTLADMESLFEGIDLGRISTSFTINSTAIIILAMYVAAALKQGVPLEKISGTTQNDMVKEFLARKTYIFPMEDSIRISVDIIEFCAKNIPKWNPINIAGYHIRESGADSIQELATVMKTAVIIAEETLKRGIDINTFAPRLSFELWTGTDFFEEVAKYRAARRIWAKIMKEEFKATNPKSMLFRVFAGGNGITLPAKEPLNNIVRVTMQSLISVLGGAQAIHAPAYDEAIATPTKESALLALRTQQIIAYESGIAKTADPLAGSYFVEFLTDELEKRAWDYMREIDEQGGLIQGITSGSIQRQVQQRAYEVERKIQSGERVVVGVNKFNDECADKLDIPIYQADDSVLKKQKARLAEVKRMRDGKKVALCLEQVRIAAKNKVNLFPSILEAVQSYASIGEITGVLREEIGEYCEPSIF